MVLASQVAAVLAVVISLLLLEAERALADGPQAGEDSEEQPDDAPDVETPLAKSACCHDLIFEACTISFSKLAWGSEDRKIACVSASCDLMYL